MFRPDPNFLCRYCGEPLPPREPNKRGRPAVTHAGECRRKYMNRQKLEYRIARFRAAQGIQADRSTIIPPWIATEYDYDEVADGFTVLAPPRLWGRRLMHAVEAWEASERTRKILERTEWELILAERDAASQRVAALAPAERDALLARGVARHKRRYSNK